MRSRNDKMERVLVMFCAAAALGSLAPRPVEAQRDGIITSQRGLFPHIFNLATRAQIYVNATCGERSPETYCKLVEHVPTQSEEYPQCRTCDARSDKEEERRPIWNAIDGTESWWQSPNIANGLRYHWVTITLDLGQVYQVAYVIVKAANSPRPGNWILERSLDGEMYKPWQYFAISDSECAKYYGIAPSKSTHRFSRDDEVICTSVYSKLEPLENGEIHTSIINGRPTAANPSRTLLDFTAARFIRLRLQQIRTLNADLMTFNTRDVQYIDPIVSRRYYYSLKDISIGGQCICYGHAEQCILDPNAGPNDLALKCICEHNTCGDQCNQCCPGFHQKPWQPGNADFGNSCQACNCHGHAEECFYDAKIDEQGRSLNAEGDYDGGGVCSNCRDNTAGINCETCREGYYRPLGVEPSDPQPCFECNCSPIGSRQDSNLNCVKDDSKIFGNKNPGDCFCKDGFAGPKCDKCARGYRGYPNCQKCQCSDAGSSNEDPCEGPCVCKANVEGTNCDVCRRGYFNLDGDNADGCVQCFCFGITTECYSVPWGITQVTTLNGWFVTNVRRSAYAFPDTTGVDMLSISHYKALEDLGEGVYYWFASRDYLGNKLASHGGYLTYTVSYSIHRGDGAQEPTRDIDVVLEGNGLRLYQSFFYLRPEVEQTVQVQMAAGDWYILTPDIDPSTGVMGQRATQEEFMSVLADITMLLIRASYNTRPRVSRLKDVRLEEVNQDTVTPAVLASVEQCVCPPTYEGLSCESCAYGYRRVNNALYLGQCERCDCHNHSPDCDAFTGECTVCDHFTYGPHCELCQPGYYGDATSGLVDACQPCACPRMEQGASFSPTCVADARYGFVCDQCEEGHGGPRCDRCVDGYFGDPMTTGMSCKPCSLNCNGNLDNASPGSCDTYTGECLRCMVNTTGEACEKCAVGFYGDAITEKNCQACDCLEAGSLSAQCNEVTGACQCRSNVTGRRCNTCQPGHYNVSIEGCQSCDCDTTGSLDVSCDVITGQCHCKPGVAGRQCDQCDAGFWNFAETGCQSCDCEQSGGLCDQVTGQCGCPPNVIGQRCDMCAPATWGYNPKHGCKVCNCSESGSSGQRCDQTTGQCKCFKSFENRQCDTCSFGHYGYPECRRCKCSRKGRDPASCKGKLCGCDQEGNCICKANIVGRRCSKCSKGSFSLQPRLPGGCTSCFCFGVADKCSQADYVASRLEMTSEQANALTVSDGLMTIVTQAGVDLYPSGAGVNLTAARGALGTREVYWSLPQPFLGNKVTAYGGTLKYKIDYQEPKKSSAGSDLRPYLPHIMILGGSHSLVVPVDSLDGKSRPKLELLEFNFLHQRSDQPPTREEFMMTLQSIEAILIPATQTYSTLASRISSIYLDVGVPRGNDTKAPTILGLEQCKCPKGYRGTSCEDCMAGYVRVQEGPYLGRCELCTCNKHSEICDDGNGRCKDCKHNTAGSRCHLCAPGYHGDATRGKRDDCQPCACPLRETSNNFSPTCETAPDGGFVCTACPRGYQGRYCEQCADGYYGNPLTPGGACHPCACNEHGSNSTGCDMANGQCHCIAGVTGRTCDECGPRHVVDANGCTSCDDGCTGPLFDALDEMREEVDGLNISRFIPPPWPQLHAVVKERNRIQDQVDSYERAVIAANDLIASLPNGTNDLRAMSRRLNRKVDKLTEEFGPVAENASDLYSRAEELNDQVNSTNQLINETTQRFRNLFVTQGLEPASENAALIRQALAILEEMGGVDFLEDEVAALEELRLANLTLQKTNNGYAAMLQALIDRMLLDNDRTDVLTTKLHDLAIRCNMVDTMTAQAAEIIQGANQTSLAIQDMTDQTEEKHRLSQAELREAEGLLNKASDLLRMANTSLEVTVAEGDNLTLVLPDLVSRADMNEASLTQLREETDLAAAHANQLHNTSKELEKLLNVTQWHAQSPLSAVRAYSDMVAAINDAHNASWDAKRAADRAHDQVFPEGGPSLVDQAKAAKDRSLSQLEQTRALDSDLTNLTSYLTDLKETLDSVNASQRNVTRSLDGIKSALPPLEEDLTSDALMAINISMATMKMAADAFNKSAKMIERAGKLKERLEGIGTKYDEYVNTTYDIENAVEETSRIADEIGMKLMNLRHQAKNIGRFEVPISANLSLLRDKIRHARTEASRINVALLSRGDCARTYRPTASSSAFNALVLNVNISRPNNMLFYIGSNITGDYLSVETVEGQVRLRWELGSGMGEITHPTNMSTKQDWYRVSVERFAETVSVKVEDTEQTKAASGITVSGSSPLGKSILDVREDSNLFIAGIPSAYIIPEVNTKSYNGCIGEVIFDDVTIGLWNFLTIEGSCQGCFRSPVTTPVEEGSYFDGTGYTTLTQPPLWDSHANSLTFEVKTLSENGLLLFSAAKDQRSFLSLEMDDGHLVMKFDLGDGEGTIVSSDKINNGAWHSISINRLRQMGKMQIDTVTVGTTHSPGDAEMLQVGGVDSVYIGGVPSYLGIVRNITSSNFRGCLRKFYLYRARYPLVLPGKSFGVTQGCIEQTERSVGLSGQGFVAFRPNPLGRETDIAVTFRTLIPNATVLAAAETQGRKRRELDRDAIDISYALGLIDGRIVAQVNNGQGRLTLQTKKADGLFNNGSAHNVVLTKRDRRITLIVNDRRADTGRLTGTEVYIPAMSPLYIGSSANLSLSPEFMTLPNFSGCIENLVIMQELIGFEKAQQFENVSIGTCGPLMIPSTALPPPPIIEKTPCYSPGQPSMVSTAGRFGSVSYSHIAFTMNPEEVAKVFEITVELKTKQKDGLIFYMADARENYFAALQLMEGFVSFNFKIGNSADSIISDFVIDDGIWHIIEIARNRKTGSLQVDGTKRKKLKSDNGRKRLTIDSPIYIGGLPADKTSQYIYGNGFDGCIRKFQLNNIEVNLAGTTNNSHGVVTCYTDTEAGNYFQGIGYALLANQQQIDSNFDLLIEFRTAQKQGLLFAATDPSGVGMSLQIRSNDIYLLLYTGRRMAEITFEARDNFTICDYEWHEVRVMELDGLWKLSVDGVMANNLRGTVRLPGDDRYSFYVGGNPLSDPDAPSFRGCVRHLEINGVLFGMDTAMEIVGVVPLECPRL